MGCEECSQKKKRGRKGDVALFTQTGSQKELHPLLFSLLYFGKKGWIRKGLPNPYDPLTLPYVFERHATIGIYPRW
jgi:hypothetical protein